MEKVDKLPKYVEELQDMITTLNAANSDMRRLSKNIADIQKNKYIQIGGVHIYNNIGEGYNHILNGLYYELERNKIVISIFANKIQALLKECENIRADWGF